MAKSLNQAIKRCHPASSSRQLVGGFCPLGHRLDT
jgi:hypothetical protein